MAKPTKIGSIIVAIMTVAFSMMVACRTIDRISRSKPITHELWDSLLQDHVDSLGWVDYEGFIRDSARLNKYLTLLTSAHPNKANWSKEEQMAYWINAYNAFTVKLITNHYPVGSIKDIQKGLPFINSVWDIKFILIEGHTYDLNNIEHNILRPVFQDARVHAAINCASFSCPKLQRQAFTADRLHEQLDKAMAGFLMDPVRNKIGEKNVEISEIFKWFKGDFVRDEGSLTNYISKFSPVKLKEGISLNFIDYDWRLNDAKAFHNHPDTK